MLSSFPRALLLIGGLLLGGGSLRAVDVVVTLPSSVTLVGFSAQTSQITLQLSASALSTGVTLPTGAALQMQGGACVITVPTGGGTATLRTVSASSGSVQIVVGSDNATAATTGPLSAPATSVATATPSPPAPPPPPAPVADTLLAASAPAPAPAPTAPAPTPPVPAPPAPGPVTSPAPAAFTVPASEGIKFDPMSMVDYAVPDVPASAALGSSTALLRPSSPRETVTSLLSHFDENGKLQSGFSVAVTPYTFLRKEPLTAKEYADSATARFLTNLQLSFAGLPDTDASTGAVAVAGARYSAGLSLLFFDEGDLRLKPDALADINQLYTRDISDARILGGTAAAFSDTINQNAAALWKAKRAQYWNASSAGMGISPVFISPSGDIDDLQGDGAVVWLSYTRPGFGRFTDQTQFIFGGSARLDQHFDHNGTSLRGDVYDFGAQLRFGSGAFNGFAEAIYRYRSITDQTEFVYEIGLEKRLNDGLWLNLSWSNNNAVTGGEIIRTGLRYGFGDKAVLSDPAAPTP